MRDYKLRAIQRNLAHEQFPDTYSNTKHDFSYGTGVYNDGINTWLILDNNEGKTFSQLKAITIDTETVGEYCGLKDKNGIEIYEGDIVKFGDIDRIVTFEKGSFVLRIIKMFFSDPTPLHYCNLEKLEVIGNIYENPALMEVQTNE